MRPALGLGVVLLLATALIFGSAYAAFRELQPFFALSGSNEERVDILASSSIRPGLSYRSKQTVVNDCAEAMTGLAILSVETEAADRVYQNCGVIASDVVAHSPSFSYAWYVLALTIRNPEDAGRFADALVNARRTSPNQEGLVYYRAMLAYSRWDRLDATTRNALTPDFAVTATSQRGRSWMARVYLSDLEFRETIIAALETVPPDIQRSFLRAVSAAGG